MDKFVVRTARNRRPADDSGGELRPCKKKRVATDDDENSEGQTEVANPETDDDVGTCEVQEKGSVDVTDSKKTCTRRKISAENLDCDYIQLFSKKEADELYQRCESELVYNTGKLAQVHIFGKWHNIPRKQVAHGDEGLSYTFSNNCIPAKPWTPLLMEIRDKITRFTDHRFNFVLINRYKDGNDHMGEHQDDEKDLVRSAPIASLSLGQPRDFVFRHAESRGKNAKRHVPPVTVELHHGSLLMMNYPTNVYWYHSLPRRKKANFPRINMTFREMVV